MTIHAARDPFLPRLPIPSLRSTCETLVSLMAPLLPAPALARSHEAVAAFRTPGGGGEMLHRALCQKAAELPGNASWLRPLWDDMYLAWRAPLPGNLNYVLRFDEERWGGASALPRLVLALARVFDALGRGEVPPERTKAGFQSMDSFQSCVYTRVPGASRDTLAPVALAGEHTILVACKGHWYILPLRNQGGGLVGERPLARAFAAIRAAAAAASPAPPVAALTAAPRAQAAALRDALLVSPRNRLSFAALEKTLFAVCLEEAHTGDGDFSWMLLGGQAANRWFDKSLQIIASENGGLGANYEHAGCDASIWMYLFSLADAYIRENAFWDNGDGPPPHRELAWEADPGLSAALLEQERSFGAVTADLRVACGEFAQYSREGLIGLKTSPDAFLQTAFQAAQYRMFGTLRSSYESVSVRNFYQGRTECARGSSAEALAVARALESGAPDAHVGAFYRRAEQIHLARLAQCRRGLGAERHLFGLECMYALYGRELGLDSPPALFASEGWRTVGYNAVSTSALTAPFIRYFGFPPTVPDGFGVGYVPGSAATNLLITSFAGEGLPASDFLTAFENAAASLYRALAANA